MQMPSNEVLQEKWAPLLNYDGIDPIKDAHRKAVTAQLLAVSYTHLTLPTNREV